MMSRMMRRRIVMIMMVIMMMMVMMVIMVMIMMMMMMTIMMIIMMIMIIMIMMMMKGGHEETEENLINFLESRLQDHERLRGGLLYIQQIPRDENWKVVKSVLQAIKPPAKYEDSAEKVEPHKEADEADSALSPE